MENGIFVTIEGIDGSGKSSVTDALWKEYDSFKTQEPSDWWTGEHLRECLSDSTTNAETDFFAFMSDRMHHLAYDIIPELEQGSLVLCDRYIDSTYAYQGQELDKEYIRSVMEPVVLEPDLTLFLDADPEVAIERTDTEEKFENVEFLESVQEEYRRLNKEKDRFVRVDANRKEEDVINGCKNILDIYYEL